MNRKSLGMFILIFAIFLVACEPSEQAIQDVLEKTQDAETTNTSTPEPTSTFTLEPTFTATATQTLTPTPTQTLTSTPDTRVITVDPKDLMLAKDDLPLEAKYYLPNAGWISPHHNSEIVSAWGVEEGTKYLEETGRIDGWWVYYKRGTNVVRAPDEVWHNIIQYLSTEGALLTISKYKVNERIPEYEIMNSDVLIGDATIIYRWKEMQSNGEYWIGYRIETAYRNYVSNVAGWGWEKEFDLDYVIRIAEIAMEKIKAAPLGNW